MNNRTNLAHAIAKYAHEGQKYGREDYYEYHVCSVASNFAEHTYHKKMVVKDGVRVPHVDKEPNPNHDEDAYIVALLHDVVEDSNVTFPTLYNLFDYRIVEAVRIITNDQAPMFYKHYIEHFVTENEIAIKVKIADLEFHLSQPNAKDFPKHDDYVWALDYLTNLENEE